jgi:hypothetical protein
MCIYYERSLFNFNVRSKWEEKGRRAEFVALLYGVLEDIGDGAFDLGRTDRENMNCSCIAD